MRSKYRVFLEAFLITALIFSLGFFVGYYVENSRTASIIHNYQDNEIEALDLKLQNYYYQIMGESSCKFAIEQNFIFADNIYNEGLEIEKAEEANQITDNLLPQKKRYALLKTELWLNTILLKEKCNNPFDTIVYFFSNDNSNNLKVAEQKIISNVLRDVKEEKGNQVILIPIAGDLGISIVDLQESVYNVTSLPTIIINEKVKLEGFHNFSEINSYMKY